MRHDESRFSILTQQNFGSNCFHANQNFVDQHRKIALRLIRFVFFPILYVYCLFSLLYFCFTLCCSLLRIGRLTLFRFSVCIYIFFSLSVFVLPFIQLCQSMVLVGIVVLCTPNQYTCIHSSVSICWWIECILVCISAYTNTCVRNNNHR